MPHLSDPIVCVANVSVCASVLPFYCLFFFCSLLPYFFFNSLIFVGTVFGFVSVCFNFLFPFFLCVFIVFVCLFCLSSFHSVCYYYPFIFVYFVLYIIFFFFISFVFLVSFIYLSLFSLISIPFSIFSYSSHDIFPLFLFITFPLLLLFVCHLFVILSFSLCPPSCVNLFIPPLSSSPFQFLIF